MKKYIEAEIEPVPGNDVLSEIYVKLQEIENDCDYLENFYWNDDAINAVIKLRKCIKKADSYLDEIYDCF